MQNIAKEAREVGWLVAAVRAVRRSIADVRLPHAAKAEAARDRSEGLRTDPGAERAIRAATDWLCLAHDASASADGGVARDFSLVNGWAPSYPETTGYIIPTMIAAANYLQRPELRARARRMTDWLVSIQFPEGGFQGGVIGIPQPVPVTFNTGQILLGLSAAIPEFGPDYADAAIRAANWLLATQDADGCWRRYSTPFAVPGDKSYETHVAWGLMEAERVLPGRGYGDAALRNVRWALTHQRRNGWFDCCGLMNNLYPLTHTIGYALRGVLEAYRLSGDEYFLHAAIRTAYGLVSVQKADGTLPGRLDENWRGVVKWSCLSGNVQIAICWFMLARLTGDARYRDAANAATAFVRRTIALDGPPEVRGAVKGSFPVDGLYGRFEYLSWANKFFIDANLMEIGAM